MILSPTSAIEKTLRIALDSATETIDEIKGVWSQTSKRSLDVINRASKSQYDYKSYSDANGITHHALIGTDDGHFGYADVKMMTCAIGDLFNAGMIAPLRIINKIDSAMGRLEKLIERYIARWTKDVISYVKETLKDLMFWKKFYCWGDKIIKWLSELNDKYGGKTIQEWHPFLADFCILAKECPLLKEYVLETPYMKNLATKINRQSDQFDLWVTQTTAEAQLAVGEAFSSPLVSDWVSSTVEFYKNAKNGTDSTTQGLENMKFRSDIRALEISIRNENDPIKKKLLESQLASKKNEYNSYNESTTKIRNNVRKYVSSVLTLDDIRKRAENSSIGYTPDQLSRGIPIGLDGKAQVEFDENGKAQSISYVDNSGNVCKKSPFDMNTYEPSDDMSKILERLCNFTLGDLFQNVLDMINEVMSTISSVVDTAVDTLGRWLKSGISFVKKSIINPFLSAIQKSFPFSDVIVKIMNFYKDWLKCQSLFCPSPYTDKLVKMGRKLMSQFRSHIRYEMVPRLDSEGNEMKDSQGNIIKKKTYYYAVDELLSSRLIDPFINGITGIIDATAFAVKAVAHGCDKESNGDGEVDLTAKTLKQWDTFIKPVVDTVDDLIFTVIDAGDIIRCLKAEDPTTEYLSRAGMTGTWLDDNKEEIELMISKIPSNTDFTAREKIIHKWKLMIKDIRALAQEEAKTYDSTDETTDSFQSLVLSSGLQQIIESAINKTYGELPSKDRVSKVRDAIDKLKPWNESSYTKIANNVSNGISVLSYLKFSEGDSSVLKQLGERYRARMAIISTKIVPLEFLNNNYYVSEDSNTSRDIKKFLGEFALTVMPKTIENLAKTLKTKLDAISNSQGYLGTETLYDRITDDTNALVNRYVGLGDSFRRKLSQNKIFISGEWVNLSEVIKKQIDSDLMACDKKEIVNEYLSVLFIDNGTLSESFLDYVWFEMRKANITFSMAGLSSSFATTSKLSTEELKSLEEKARAEFFDENGKKFQEEDNINTREIKRQYNLKSNGVITNKELTLDNINIKGANSDAVVISGEGSRVLMDTATNSRTVDKNSIRKTSAVIMGLDLNSVVIPDSGEPESMTVIQELKQIIR